MLKILIFFLQNSVLEFCTKYYEEMLILFPIDLLKQPNNQSFNQFVATE